MRVSIYDMPNDLPIDAGPEHGTLRGVGDLTECFPDDPMSVADAEDQIAATGRTWHGGGAAPLVLLVPVV